MSIYRSRTADPTKILTRRELAAVLADLVESPRSPNTRMNLVLFRLAACCGLRASPHFSPCGLLSGVFGGGGRCERVGAAVRVAVNAQFPRNATSQPFRRSLIVGQSRSPHMKGWGFFAQSPPALEPFLGRKDYDTATLMD